MKATGIVRRIDDLGRIVVPKEIRRTLRIREGDPLEIFTSREGEIMLKKYSPVGELGEFARSYAQALAQTTEALVCITDREYVIAAAGTGKKEVEGEQLSEEMEEMIEKRSTVVKTGEEQACSITKKTMSTLPKGIVLSSILCNGDCQGAVILADNSGQKETLGLLKALSATAANFLGKNMALSLAVSPILFIITTIYVYLKQLKGYSLIMDEKGCAQRFLFLSKHYSWKNLRVKLVASEESHCGEGVLFIKKKSGKSGNSSSTSETFSYASLHPYSSFVANFEVPGKMYGEKDALHEISKELFLEKMKEWGVEVEGLPKEE